jgi:hypothetical protein
VKRRIAVLKINNIGNMRTKNENARESLKKKYNPKKSIDLVLAAIVLLNFSMHAFGEDLPEQKTKVRSAIGAVPRYKGLVQVRVYGTV